MKPEHCNTDIDWSCSAPRLKFADGGRLVKLSFERSPAAEWNAEMFGERGGVRGKCKGFSFSSRRRMLDRLNSVSVASELPQFVTCTLPDDVFRDDVASFAELAKVCMATFLKRLGRVCPEASGFWRIEWQARKSGRYEGKLVPHFHLLVWGLPSRVLTWVDDEGGEHSYVQAYVHCRDSQLSLDLVTEWADAEGVQVSPLKPGQQRYITEGQSYTGSPKFISNVQHVRNAIQIAKHCNGQAALDARNMLFQDWASLAWYHVVNSGNRDHLKAGVRVESIKSWGGVMCYCAKYMAKQDCGFLSEVSFGRSWGIFNRKCMPWARIIEIDLDPQVGVRLRRVARRYLERVRGRTIRAPYGVTLYCDVRQFRRLWEDPPPDPF